MKSFGPYLLEAELGRGSSGVVYLARREGDARPVALKVLLDVGASDPENLARFQLEVGIGSKLHHPGIVGVRDSGTFGGRLYYAMELCQGPTLQQRLRQGPLGLDEARSCVAALARAIAHAHARSVVHRDLKPANVILEDGDPLRPRITDFGLARDRSLARSMTQTGTLIGTPYYMSPEQWRGEKGLDDRADVFSLGVILFECLAGARPFEGGTIDEVARRVLAGVAAPLPPSVPPHIAAIVRRALSVDRGSRPRAAELAVALEEGAATRRDPRRLLFVGAAVVGVVTASAGAVWLAQARAAAQAEQRARSLAAKRARAVEREAARAIERQVATRAGIARVRERSGAFAPIEELLQGLDETATAAGSDAALLGEVRLERARALFRRGRMSRAIEEGTALAAETTGRVALEARFVTAIGRLWGGQVPEGLEVLEGIWRDDPAGPVGQSAGATFHSYHGDNKRGEELARAALGLDPAYVEAKIGLAFCLSDQRRGAEGLPLLDEVLQAVPDHPRAHMARAQTLLGLGRGAEGLAALDRAIRLSEPEPIVRALHMRVKVMTAERRWAEAVAGAQRIRALAPGDVTALVFEGIAHDNLGDRPRAEACWREARASSEQEFMALLATIPRDMARTIEARSR